MDLRNRFSTAVRLVNKADRTRDAWDQQAALDSLSELEAVLQAEGLDRP